MSSIEKEAFALSELRACDYKIFNRYKPHSGKCGDVSYKFEPWNNTLKIEGVGYMTNYTDGDLYSWYKNSGEINKIIIGPFVNSIGARAFSGMIALNELNYSKSLKIIGEYAFDGCSNLSISFSNTDFENLEEIGQYVFANCKNIELKDISLGGKLRKIGRYAFGDVILSNISFKEGIEDIGLGEGNKVTFDNWKNDIKLPNSLKKIGSSSFKGDFSNIEIGSQIEYMESKSFISSATCGDFYINCDTPPACPSSLIVDEKGNSVTSLWTLYTPETAESSYATSEGWCNFKIANISVNPPASPNSDELLTDKLIGKWKNSEKLYDYYYCFAENGQGYYQDIDWYTIPGIYRKWISDWEIKNGDLFVKYVGENSYSKINNLGLLSDSEMSINKSIYSKINSNRDLDIPFKAEPYDNYVKYIGRSYPLDYVKKQMIHSSGTDNNMKFLRFQGVDEKVWYDIRYFTPYYEGIDNYWVDGTYRVNTITSVMTSCWQYIGIPCDRFYDAEDVNGKLTIKHTNNFYTYIYKSADLEIYFEGIEK